MNADHMDKMRNSFDNAKRSILIKLPKLGEQENDPICYYMAIDEQHQKEEDYTYYYFYSYDIDEDDDYSFHGIKITGNRYVEFFDFNSYVFSDIKIDLMYIPERLSKLIIKTQKKLNDQIVKEIVE